MKKLLYYCAVALVMAGVSGCSSNEPEDMLVDNGNGVQNEADNNGSGAQDNKDKKRNGWPGSANDSVSYQIVLTDAQKETVKQANSFAFNYLKTLSARKQTEGFVASPLSTAVVLGMLSEGAQGKTRADIVSVLLGGGSSDGLNDLFEELTTGLPVSDRAVSFRQANCLVGDATLSLNPAYTDTLKKYYGAESLSMDFARQQTVDYINKWCYDNTEGLIPSIVDKLSPAMRLVLMNAVYFKSTWSDKFDAKESKLGTFYKDATTQREVTFMHRYDMMYYSEGAGFTMVKLPYGATGKWNAYIILPSDGKTPDTVLARLTNESWSTMTTTMVPHLVDLKLPKLKIESDFELNEALSSLGASVIFDAAQADFSPMTTNQESLFVSLIKQKASIEFTEEGTAGAALTIDFMVTSNGSDNDENVTVYPFHANRPFIYIIQEENTQAIVFAGVYR